jgi:hypothetical protein
MSDERLASLYAFVAATALGVLAWLGSRLPDDSRTFRVIARILDSWFFSTRWSMEPRNRLRMMAVVGGIIAALMLYAFVTDPPPRYTGR